MNRAQFVRLADAGAVVFRTIIADFDPVPLTRPRRPRRAAGRLVVRFGVGGRPAPWVTHGASGSKAVQRGALRAWQAKVQNAAADAMRHAGATLAAGLVEVWADYVFTPDDKLPDRDNLVKGGTDALQGVVFINDCQVVGGEGRRLTGPVAGVVIEVWSVQPLTIP